MSNRQRRDPGRPEDDGGDDSDPMSEDDEKDSDDGDDVDGDGDGDVASTVKVAGVPLATAQAAAAAEAAKSSTNSHKFMAPIEVELQMEQLWKQEAEVLDLIFASGKQQRQRRGGAERGDGSDDATGLAASNGGGVVGSGLSGGILDGYRVFFVRALAVPPPRFRPPMHMGDMVAEHPQNVYLIKVSSWFVCLFVCFVLHDGDA